MTFLRRQPRTHDTNSFYFEPNAPLDFEPGQYLQWKLPHAQPDERGQERYFSIASSPTESEIMFTTKLSDPGSSFKQALMNLAPGQELEASEPEGDFVLPDEPGQGVVLVAGGVGITPFRSMLKFIVDKSLPTSVHLLYGCRSDQDRLFAPELDEWAANNANLKVTYILGQAPESWTGERGNLNGGRILGLIGGLNGRPLYVSGPELMVKALRDQLLAAGVPADMIRIDDFPGYADILET